MGDVEAAIENYDSSLRLASRNPKVVFRRAGLLKAKGDCNSAARAYEETLWLLNSNKHEVLTNLLAVSR
jgi:predicted TPR repeat methyltransferase